MRLITIALLFLAFLCRPLPSSATEEYAKKTGKPCAACHLDPGGGGELTAAGKEYAAALGAGVQKSGAAKESAIAFVKRGGRLVTGYLHLLTAILWFGTILYVHLVLKPAYAAGGLPKGEVRVGVMSMIVMGVTGAVLTCYRITSIDTLLHTRFGILLLVKVSLYLVMVLSGVFVVLLIGPRLKREIREGAAPAESGAFTLDELAACDGKEGRPAYFALAGKIYDVAGSKLWKQGVHMGRHHAGADLTEALKLAPHGPEQVAAMRLVGDLTAEGSRKAPLHERVFYALAYMNLSMVFVIVLIVALWRWG